MSGRVEFVRMMSQSRHDALDKAWGEINALGGTCSKDDIYNRGFCRAVEEVLIIIEDLGGMDPLQRARDNGQFGVGA